MHNQAENKIFLFSAPLPVKMETRIDLVEKKTVKIAKMASEEFFVKLGYVVLKLTT